MTENTSDSRKEFKALTYPHMRLLYNVALKYCGNSFDAEDIVQETYLMAYNKFHQLREKDKCKPWLLRILRNNFLKSYHKKKSIQKLSETDYVDFVKTEMTQDSAQDILERSYTNAWLQKAIDKLPLKYKEVLMLYHAEEMRYKDIAQTLQIPIGTVMSRLTRARQGLKTLLLKQPEKTEKILNIDFKQANPQRST